jgi:hypothetical protein
MSKAAFQVPVAFLLIVLDELFDEIKEIGLEFMRVHNTVADGLAFKG